MMSEAPLEIPHRVEWNGTKASTMLLIDMYIGYTLHIHVHLSNWEWDRSKSEDKFIPKTRIFGNNVSSANLHDLRDGVQS